jgi:hypothetical protein
MNNPREEWFRRMAELENGCEISVGGLAHRLGMLKDPEKQLFRLLVEREKQVGEGSHDAACKKFGCCKGCYKPDNYNYCAECYADIMRDA